MLISGQLKEIVAVGGKDGAGYYRYTLKPTVEGVYPTKYEIRDIWSGLRSSIYDKWGTKFIDELGSDQYKFNLAFSNDMWNYVCINSRKLTDIKTKIE